MGATPLREGTKNGRPVQPNISNNVSLTPAMTAQIVQLGTRPQTSEDFASLAPTRRSVPEPRYGHPRPKKHFAFTPLKF